MSMYSNVKSPWFAVAASTVLGLWSCEGSLAADGAEINQSAESESASSEIRSARGRSYRVTVQNVTAGNGLSPPLVVVSSPHFRLFDVGLPASAGVSKVAEQGATDVLEAELAQNDEVRATAKAEGGPIGPGQTRVIEVVVNGGGRGSEAHLNLIAMIGRSNDSFVARAQSIDLSQVDRGAITVALTNFDAGSEANSGNVEDFGPGGHPVDGAEGIVSYDRGLNLRGNAPEIAAWGSTAALLRIERIRSKE